ncbi:MAG: YtxH domain-containing protein [Pyrinomonadaceae bacterium]|jgi:gas vesicle protein|nr:YtxH domain-containing protein [Pyrinomonadaceae bacterium]
MANNKLIVREEESDVSTKLAYLLIGGTIGAAVALLFAPKSGHELRGDIADVTRKGALRTRDAAQVVGAKAGEYYETTKDRASDIYASAAGKAGELADVARESAARKGEQLSAAIEAGKQAYADEKRRTDARQIEAAPTYYEGDERLS